MLQAYQQQADAANTARSRVARAGADLGESLAWAKASPSGSLQQAVEA